MKIALAHFRVGETDGVSLEMHKWRIALRNLGHEVIFLSGSDKEGEIFLPGLEYNNLINEDIHRRAFGECDDCQKLEEDTKEYATVMEEQLIQKLVNHQIDVLVPNNILSLGHNLAAGIAFSRVVDRLPIKVIAHHHDFHWERVRYSKPTCSFVRATLEKSFPPNKEGVSHVVINSLAQEAMATKRGISSTVVPNVFDFDQPEWQLDDYNSNFRAEMGISPDDILVLQATRVTERKAIELAIETVAYLNEHQRKLHGTLFDGRTFSEKNEIVLLLAGLVEASPQYVTYLKDLAAKRKVRLIWANSSVLSERKQEAGKRFYSLWDTYAAADLITYPSILEGWGNQFLEAVFARRPIVLYEYPVFSKDIKPLGFEVASLGNTHTVEEGYVHVTPKALAIAGEQAIRYLKDQNYRQSAVEHNFQLAKKHFSYQALQSILAKLI